MPPSASINTLSADYTDFHRYEFVLLFDEDKFKVYTPV